MKKLLSAIFIFILSLPFASADVLRELERKQMEALEGSFSVENLQEYLSKQKPKYLSNKYKKNLLKEEKELFHSFYKVYQGNKSQAEAFVKQKYEDFLGIAKSEFSISDFEGLRSEARYAKLLIRKHQMDASKWEMFDFVLTFVANRLSFSYDQALEYNKKLSDKDLKKDFHAFIKRFIELEYRTGKKAEIPEDYQVFMN